MPKKDESGAKPRARELVTGKSITLFDNVRQLTAKKSLFVVPKTISSLRRSRFKPLLMIGPMVHVIHAESSTLRVPTTTVLPIRVVTHGLNLLLLSQLVIGLRILVPLLQQLLQIRGVAEHPALSGSFLKFACESTDLLLLAI